MTRSENATGATRRAMMVSGFAAATLMSTESLAADAGPVVTAVGPGLGAGRPSLRLGAFDLGAKGYVVEEFFLTGTARSFKLVGEATIDGRWTAEPDGSAAYATRIVVVRPKDPAKFSGSVAVEWLNVTGGLDAAPDWSYTHREITRRGHAWVGVSAQKVGVEGGSRFGSGGALKQADPARYGGLSHPGDAFAFDIFSQAGAVVKRAAGATPPVLGPLKPTRVLAMGESQSASYLTTYVNAVDPLARVFDGFLIHSRSGSAAMLAPGVGVGGAPGGARAPAGLKLRSDLRVPVLTLIAETDLMGQQGGGFLTARQPDTNRLRTWEMAGTAHVDNYALMVSAIDSGQAPVATIAAAWRPVTATILGKLAKPMNAAPQHHYVAMAALSHLDTWVRTGRAPPRAPRLEVATATGGPPQLVLDANGNAKGGIRSPWVDAPFARYSGLGNSGGPLGFLAGTTEPYDAETLKRLYPGGRAEYLKRFDAALSKAVKAGFILPTDVDEIRTLAAAMVPASL